MERNRQLHILIAQVCTHIKSMFFQSKFYTDSYQSVALMYLYVVDILYKDVVVRSTMNAYKIIVRITQMQRHTRTHESLTSV